MQLYRSLCFSLILAAGTTGALAQSSSSSSGEQSVFQWGGDFRFRYEEYETVNTLNAAAAFNHRDYFRARLRVWETVDPLPDLTLYGRFTVEPRYWFNAANKASEGKQWKYGIFDNFYAKWSNDNGGNPVVVTAGRQDIVIGDQWLVSDGTPLDGSWTNYFDSIRFTIDAKSLKTKFEVIALNNQAYPGDRVPILGSDRAASALQEQDETGAILYVTNKSVQNLQIDGYFIYKGDDAVTSKGYNADIYSLGSRLVGTPAEHWKYSLEGAYQWGRRNDASGSFSAANNLINYGELSRDVSAYGAIANLTYLFKDDLDNQITFTAEYLSGDDPDSGTDEMFDNLWGRVPRISECWALVLGADTGRSSYYNNLYRIGATWSFVPVKDLSVAATYGALFAVEDSPTRTTSSLLSRDSNFRGQIFRVLLKKKFSKQLSGLLLGEICPLGSFYTHSDVTTFLRAEMLVSF